MKTKRRIWLASLLSILMPGLGHLYAGFAIRAVGFYLFSIAYYNLILLLIPIESIKPINSFLPWILIFVLWIILIIDVIRQIRKQNDYKIKGYNKWYIYLGILIFHILTMSLTYFNIFRYHGYEIPSQAMENTLKVGDFLWCDDYYYYFNEPNYGDIMVFIYPRDNVTKYVKRCVGLPGDTILIKDKQLFVNRQIHEYNIKHIDTLEDGSQRIMPRREGGRDSRDNFGPYVVPENCYFMMGDNRDNSYDSRYWGVVHGDLIIGKATVIYWSDDFNRIGMVLK